MVKFYAAEGNKHLLRLKSCNIFQMKDIGWMDE